MRLLIRACVIAAMTLLLLEGALRIHDPAGLRLQGERILLPVNGRFTIANPAGPKLDPVVHQHRNALGFRGPDVPADFSSRLSIVTVGGSTTECLPQPDDGTWPAVMAATLAQTRPDVWVNNAGLLGHTTVGHLAMLEQHLRQLRPRFILYLIGANDVGYTPPGLFYGWRGRMATYSAVANLAWNIELAIRARHVAFDGVLLDPRTAPHRVVSEAEIAKLLRDDDEHVAGFRERLTRLVERTRAAGIEPILATQPLLGGDATDPSTGVSLATILEEPDGLNGLASWRQLERYNDTTRSVAASHGVALVDLARDLPKDSRLFTDFMHFSNEGAVAVGRIAGAALAARIGPGARIE